MMYEFSGESNSPTYLHIICDKQSESESTSTSSSDNRIIVIFIKIELGHRNGISV